MSNFGAVHSEGAIPESALATGTAAVPVGTILDWFPPSSAVPPYTSVLPSNWIVCAGQSWTDVNTALAVSYGSGAVNDLGFSTGNVPNLVGRVTYGASTSAARNTNATHTTSTGSQADAGVGGLVGTNAGPNAKHSHTVTLGDHYHEMDHWHGVNNHSHGIPNKNDSYGTYAQLTTSVTPTYLPTSNTTNNSQATTGGSIYHGGLYPRPNTGNAGASTTTSSDSGPDTTNNYYQDNRSAGVGVLKIMKVKNIS